MTALSPVNEQALPRLRRAVERVCKIATPSDGAGAAIDHTALSLEDQARFNDGESPSGWVEWWLTKAKHIQTLEGAALITLEPGFFGKRFVQPIELTSFEQLIGTIIWTRPAGVILAWGVPNAKMNQRHLRRIPCTGALGVHMDGCSAILVSDPSTCSTWSW